MSETLLIELAYATPERQLILECEVENGSSARDIVRQSSIQQHFPEIDLEQCDIGVWGKKVADDYQPEEGDRIEVYRPLIADPKEVRRQRAERGLRTGKGGGALNPD